MSVQFQFQSAREARQRKTQCYLKLKLYLLKHQSNFKLKLYCVNSDHNFQLIQFLFPFFSRRASRANNSNYKLQIRIFLFRDPILSSFDAHSPLEIHIFEDPKDQNLRAARAYTKKTV